MKLTVDILQDFFSNGLDLSMVVSNVAYEGTNSVATVDNLLHLRKGMKVNVSGTDYSVTDTDRANRTFTVEADLTGATSATIEPLYYIHGKPVIVNGSIVPADVDTKYPMVYVEEPFTETFQSSLSAIDRESNLRIYFMDWSNNAEWETDQHYSDRIDGLNQLFERFKKNIIADRCRFFAENTTFTVTNITNLTGAGGSSLFHDNTSGLLIEATLLIKICNS